MSYTVFHYKPATALLLCCNCVLIREDCGGFCQSRDMLLSAHESSLWPADVEGHIPADGS